MILFSTLAIALSAQGTWAEPQIILHPEMLTNETCFGDEMALINEQSASATAPPSKPFFAGWTAWQYPMNIAIDLGAESDVKMVRIYNESGEGKFELSTGTPFQWKASPRILTGYKAWNEFPIAAKTRWLRLTILQPLSISEVLVFGTAGKPLPAGMAPAGKVRTLPTMDELMGVNAFIDDPIDKITRPSGIVREYHPWGWDVEGPNAARRFQPSGAGGGNSWFFDDYYAKLKAAGSLVAPVIWQAPQPLFDVKSREAKPIKAGTDPEQPKSYQVHAAHFFQFAARYGASKVPDSDLDLAPGQPRKSGLGLLHYIENWNEPDKTWEGSEGRFSPYHLAAISSADYDGHKGKMGKRVGVKQADPKMKLVMGGLAGLNLNYIQAMKLWSDYHRGGDFPADVLNIHHYSNTAGEQGFQPGGQGFSPERDDLLDKLTKFSDWRDRNLHDRELWLTEFGYDTNPKSPIHAPAIGSLSAEQVQGAWLVRAYMAIAAARFDRAMMFMLRDVDSKGEGVFSTSGLVTEKGQWNPKPSWNYLVTLRSTLRGYRFSRILPSRNATVWVYEFTKKGSAPAYVIWCPTESDTLVKDFPLWFVKGKAEVVEFSDRDPNGIRSPLAPGARLTVSEIPKIVLSTR